MSTSPKVAFREQCEGVPAPRPISLTEHWDAVPRIRACLKQVDTLLAACIEDDPSAAVRRVSLHLIQAGGKRLRPALVLLSGEVVGGDAASVTPLAVAMELLHVATLYHDDVIDGALTRRGLPSTNALWGDRVSAMAGTYLIAKAMDTLAAHGDDVLSFVNSAVNQVWHGEMRELEGVYHPDRTEAAYLECVSNKTAAFYQLPCCLGAMGAGGDERQVAALRAFGQFTGMAFQLIDDLLDLVSSDDAIGKPAGSDMKAGVYTLPVIRTLESSDRLRTLLAGDSLLEAHRREALEIVRAGDGIEHTLQRAVGFVEQGIAELSVFPEGLPARALRVTARSVVQRPELDSWRRDGLGS